MGLDGVDIEKGPANGRDEGEGFVTSNVATERRSIALDRRGYRGATAALVAPIVLVMVPLLSMLIVPMLVAQFQRTPTGVDWFGFARVLPSGDWYTGQSFRWSPVAGWIILAFLPLGLLTWQLLQLVGIVLFVRPWWATLAFLTWAPM